MAPLAPVIAGVASGPALRSLGARSLGQSRLGKLFAAGAFGAIFAGHDDLESPLRMVGEPLDRWPCPDDAQLLAPRVAAVAR
jgi:hypothetical protein